MLISKRPFIRFFNLSCLVILSICAGAFSVYAQSVISLSIVTTQASCTNTNGSITINASAGSAPYQYSADNGVTYQAANVFNGLDSGLYNIVVKDAGGLSASQSVRLTAIPSPIVNLGSDTVLC